MMENPYNLKQGRCHDHHEEYAALHSDVSDEKKRAAIANLKDMEALVIQRLDFNRSFAFNRRGTQSTE